MTKVNGNKFLLKFSYNTYIVVTKDKGWVYRVSRIKSFKEVIILRGPEEGYPRVSEAISAAYNYCTHKTDNGLELELWEET